MIRVRQSTVIVTSYSPMSVQLSITLATLASSWAALVAATVLCQQMARPLPGPTVFQHVKVRPFFSSQQVCELWIRTEKKQVREWGLDGKICHLSEGEPWVRLVSALWLMTWLNLRWMETLQCQVVSKYCKTRNFRARLLFLKCANLRKLVFNKGFFIRILIYGRSQLLKINIFEPAKMAITKISRFRKVAVLQYIIIMD